MTTRTFRYTNNGHNLWAGLFCAGLLALFVWKLLVPLITRGEPLWIVSIFCLLAALFGWLAIHFLKTYLRLRGHERQIIMGERSITFPEFGDSLNVIKLDFARISEIYIALSSKNVPGNLMIKYDQDGHAYIGRQALEKKDFDEICDIFKSRLKLEEITTKR